MSAVVLMRKALALAVAVALLLCSFGCEANRNDPEDVEDNQDKLVIGFSMATLKEDRWLRDRDIFTAKAQQEGIDVIVTNANNKAMLQYEQVSELLEAGIDVLVIAPYDCDSAASCVKLAQEVGVPVISYDRLVSNANVDLYISFDNVKVGQLQGEAALSQEPWGNYLLLNGSPNDNNSGMFNSGVMLALEKPIAEGRVNIIGEKWVYDWLRETAFEFVREQLTKNDGQIDAIICANDSLAWAAVDALSEAQLAGEVVVIGHDADLTACQRIVLETQYMTVYKPIKTLVEYTLSACRTLAEGGSVEVDRQISDGSYNVDYLSIDVIAVTAENMDETVIKDGFHLAESIYSVLPEPSSPSDSE